MGLYKLTHDLEPGKCYYISGITSGIGGGESVEVELGTSPDFDSIGTVTTNGSFSLLFSYSGSPLYTEMRITITGTGITVENFKLRQQQACSDTVCTECYVVTNCEPPHREHLLLEWTNNEDGLGFNYSGMSFNQSLYIVGGLRNADYPYDEELFQDSIQQRFPIYAQSTKTKELWIHDLPEYLHDAIRVALIHDEFYIDGVRQVKMEGAYSPDWDTPNSLLAPAIVTLTEFSQDTVNDNCG